MSKRIDYSSLVIDGVDSRDYPDFVDAYVSYGLYFDGTQIDGEDLDELNDKHPELAQSLAFESLLN